MLFHLLARRTGRVFSQREIYELVAPDSFNSSWTGISSIIYKLRHKLNADFIQTVYGKGYKFFAAVTLLHIQRRGSLNSEAPRYVFKTR